MKKSIETADIILAAALKCHGNSLDAITKIGQRGNFHFSNVETNDLEKFDLGSYLVDPVQFNAVLKSLVTATRRVL